MSKEGSWTPEALRGGGTVLVRASGGRICPDNQKDVQ